jgi:BirA family transcriptional regulator, biotin operon repressor / biotin---[acetyl-CoA-carboxylase] ligase
MIGTPRVHYRLTDSTNERAKELADRGALHGTLVTADEQQAGRGRQGRVWTAPPGSAVLMSLILRGLDERHALLPLAAAVAVCEACETVARSSAPPSSARASSAQRVPSPPVRVKWPNDVWIDGRKVAGILIEGRPQEGWAVLGIGLNVTTESFPPELADIATSLLQAGYATTPPDVLHELLTALDQWITAPPEAVLAAWRERDALKGERVRWSDGEGIADGIDDSGALRVQTGNGPVTLDAGEVHLHR